MWRYTSPRLLVNGGWMSRICLGLLLLLSTASGCSSLIARSGLDMETLTCRSDVESQFGVATGLGENQSGTSASYRTRRKISDPMAASGYGMEFVMLFGLREPKNVAVEMREITRNIIQPQRIEVTFDDNGNVIPMSNPHGRKTDPIFPRFRITKSRDDE